MLDSIVPENVVSNLTDEEDISSKPLGGNCLIGSFPSGTNYEIIA